MTELAKKDIYEDHKQKIDKLNDAILNSGLPILDMEPNHYFAHGTYTRELFIPKGTVIAGKIHKNDCIAIIVYGHVKVTTDKGDYDIKGPKVLVTGSGSKGVYALEDTLWVTVHPWDGETDLKTIENAIIDPSYEALEQTQERLEQ